MEDLQAREANIPRTLVGRTADRSPPFCDPFSSLQVGLALETGADSFARIPTSSCTSAKGKSTMSNVQSGSTMKDQYAIHTGKHSKSCNSAVKKAHQPAQDKLN